MLMQHDGTLEKFPFRGPLYMHAKSPIKKLLKNNSNMYQSQRTSKTCIKAKGLQYK